MFHTGDFGFKDDSGWFHFADRKKDYIRRRGENVSSWDVEQAIFICQEYLPQQPGHMSGHIVYGQALFEAGRTDEARSVIARGEACVEGRAGDFARLRVASGERSAT